MATPREHLLKAYEAVAVPSPLKTIELDADPVVREAEDTLVTDVVAALRLGEAASRLLEIRREMIVPITPADSHLRATDDFYASLRLKNVQTLVMVERHRTDFNAMVANYAKVPLSEAAIARILAYSAHSEEF